MVKKLIILQLVVVVILTGIEWALGRPAYFAWDGVGFFAGFGFIACAALIGLAKGLGFLIQRQDDYYHKDRHDV